MRVHNFSKFDPNENSKTSFEKLVGYFHAIAYLYKWRCRRSLKLAD